MGGTGRILVRFNRNVMNTCVSGSVLNVRNTKVKSAGKIPALVLDRKRVSVSVSLIDQAREGNRIQTMKLLVCYSLVPVPESNASLQEESPLVHRCVVGILKHTFPNQATSQLSVSLWPFSLVQFSSSFPCPFWQNLSLYPSFRISAPDHFPYFALSESLLWLLPQNPVLPRSAFLLLCSIPQSWDITIS